MSNDRKFYTAASSAARGAKRAGIENARIEHDPENGFYFVEDKPEPAPVAVVGLKTSTITSPVDLIWEFVAANPEMSRKDVIAVLTEKGCALGTIKTQYQRIKSGYVRNPRKRTAA